MSWYQSAYPRDLDVTRVAVPTGLTDLSTVNTEIWEVLVSNTTGAPISFLLQDKQSSPLAIIPTVSIAAATSYLIVSQSGIRCPGGVSWQAGGAGLVATLRGRKDSGWAQAAGSQYVTDTTT